jgi:hypothetical protein
MEPVFAWDALSLPMTLAVLEKPERALKRR